ncbi:MAG: hypothetical protein NT056_09165, partial [Proteobacteria bacterium]|nr:hypothetical protein [Pseudomonadota bacterium]
MYFNFSRLNSSGLLAAALLLCLGFPRTGTAFTAAGKFSVDPFRSPSLASSGEKTDPVLLAEAGTGDSPAGETAEKNPAPKPGKQRYFSNEGMAMTLFGAVLWQQTLATKEMLLVWPTAVFGTIAVLLGPFSLGYALFEGETPRGS